MCGRIHQVKRVARGGSEAAPGKGRRAPLGLLVLGCAAGLAALSGCSGQPAALERQAREDLRVTEGLYRPDSGQPAFPELSASASLEDLTRCAFWNNPRVAAAFYEWKAAVEEVAVSRSLPDPMLNLSAEIVRGISALTPMLMTDPMERWPFLEGCSGQSSNEFGGCDCQQRWRSDCSRRRNRQRSRGGSGGDLRAWGRKTAFEVENG